MNKQKYTIRLFHPKFGYMETQPTPEVTNIKGMRLDAVIIYEKESRKSAYLYKTTKTIDS